MPSVYLDHGATTPVANAVLQQMLPYFTANFGNPSSIHQFGQKTKTALEKAREQVANGIAAKASEIVFLSGGTESINLAIQGAVLAHQERGNHIITSSVEHRAVLETCQQLEKQGFSITFLNPDPYGQIHPDQVVEAIQPDTILVSIMHANNEIGTVNPIAEIGQITRQHDIIFHTDAVQTFGKFPIDVNNMNIDLLSCSAHKIYGPKGVGALYVRQGIPFSKIAFGGEQERNKRGGTENIPGIVGFGKAVEMSVELGNKESQRLDTLQWDLQGRIEENIPDVSFNGHPIEKIPGNLSVMFKGVDAESLLISLDMKGIAASNGSACSSGSSQPSHVLCKIGLPLEDVKSTLRFSLGRSNTLDDIVYTAKVLAEEVERIRLLTVHK